MIKAGEHDSSPAIFVLELCGNLKNENIVKILQCSYSSVMWTCGDSIRTLRQIRRKVNGLLLTFFFYLEVYIHRVFIDFHLRHKGIFCDRSASSRSSRSSSPFVDSVKIPARIAFMMLLFSVQTCFRCARRRARSESDCNLS